MAEPTQPTPEQPTPPHRTPSRVANEPATVQACATDYENGKAVRTVMDNQDAKKRSTR